MSTIIMVRGTSTIDSRLNIAASQCLKAAEQGSFPYLTMATDYEAVKAECEKLDLFTGDFTLILPGGVDGGFLTVEEVRPFAELAMQNEWEFGTLEPNSGEGIENTDAMIFELQDKYGGRDQYEYVGGNAFDNVRTEIKESEG